jgi:geranylgeranyl diphosphate synthase type 3
MKRCVSSTITLRKPFYELEIPKAILEPFQFITSNPGKEIRGKLIEAFNLWLDVPASKLKVIAKIVNMLHAASLM